MSMANLIVQRDAAYLMTDSGYFRGDGTLHMIGCKVLEMPEVCLAIALAGCLMPVQLANQIEQQRACGQAEFIRRIPGLVAAAYIEAELNPRTDFTRVLVARYSSEQDSAGGFVMSTQPAGTFAAWKLHPVSRVLSPHIELAEIFDRDTLCEAATFDPARDAQPLIAAQRMPRSSWEAFEGEIAAVAGDIRLTAVTRTGVSTTTVHTYADKVGEKILG